MKKIVLLFITLTIIAFESNAQTVNCSSFCVLSIGNVDSVNNELDVTIYNGDTNHVNYPTIIIVDALGDTIANKTDYFYLFAHLAGDTVTQTIPCYVNSIPTSFTGTVYLIDRIWNDTCSFAYPMTCTVGINDAVASNTSFLVFPNPVSDIINIHLSELKNNTATINLYDTSARLVKTVLTTETTLSIERGDLRSGVYFITVLIGDKQLTKKIVLE
jgi:hypothetical protein